MDLEKRAFSCQRGAFTVRGFEYKGAQNNGVPVIISHPFMSNQRIMKKYAEALAQKGYVAFTYDFCGGAMFGKSSGSFRDMSIDTEKDDLKAVIRYVDGLGYVDGSQLILLGASQGGFVSCLVASECQERLSKLILLYPALCIPENARSGKMLMITFDPGHIQETIKSGPFKFSAKYPESAINIDIYAVLQSLRLPIRIIHGTADSIVDVEYARKAVAYMRNSASDLVTIDGAGHGFTKKPQFAQAMRSILDYLN